MSEEAELHRETWEVLKTIIDSGNSAQLQSFLDTLSSGDTARAISRLDQGSQNKLFDLLDPTDAADLIEDLPDAQAKDLIEDLPEEQAAAIVEELPSDQQADLLGALQEEDAEAILQEMDPEEAKDARQLLSYSPETAGGLMVTEFLRYDRSKTVEDVVNDLRANAETYSTYDVFYAYITGEGGTLVGVVKLRDLVLSKGHTTVEQLMIRDPVYVRTDESLDDLKSLFDRHDFFGVPVTDRHRRLMGVVRRPSVQEAIELRTERNFLRASGIIGGEELRSLPIQARAVHRLWFLIIKIGLNLISASVIAAFSDTLSAVITLALFLPIISDLGGVSGNQALAVSIRELATGIIKPRDLLLVFMDEVKVGVFIGVILGLVLGLVTFFWQNNIYLGLVVGGALVLNTIIAVCFGGVMPLLLKRLQIDPAVASSGILTFVTDAVGFFLVLGFATLVLSKIAA